MGALTTIAEASAVTFSWSDVSSILSNVTSQFSMNNLVSIVGGILGITAVFGVFWFAVRKGVDLVQRAVKSGKISA